MSRKRPFADPAVRAAFEAYPRAARGDLLDLRALIFEAAAEIDTIGSLVETLRWRQPAYLPARSRVGTTIRIDALDDGCYALFVHCQTTLAARFRQAYPDLFRIDGKRAVLFVPGAKLPRDALKHCIQMALTYHVRPAASRA